MLLFFNKKEKGDNKKITESRLIDLTKIIYNNEEIITNKKFIYKENKLNGFMPDIYIPNRKLIIEFDGYRHFSISKTVLRDIRFDNILQNVDINIIHIPYFIQIDTLTFPLIFRFSPSVELIEILKEYRYPHGFIDEKALLPSDFCTLGIKRFRYFLNRYEIVKNDIILSLDNHIKNKEILEVYPSIEFYEEFHK